MKKNSTQNTPPACHQHEAQADSQRNILDIYSVNVTTEYALLQFLSGMPARSRKHKYTRAEAYFDLIRRQRMTALTGDICHMAGGIEELKNSWHWSRDTVSKFISQLVSHKAAVTSCLSTSVVVILTNIDGLPPLPEVISTLQETTEKI